MVTLQVESKDDLEYMAEDLANGVEDLLELPRGTWGWDDIYERLLLKLKEYNKYNASTLRSKSRVW